MQTINVVVLFLLLPMVGWAQSWSQSNPIVQEFTTDTSLVEQQIRTMLDHDCTTWGMIDASVRLEAEYDVLLNKYYKQLMSLLPPADRAVLKATQLNWIKYRDSEKKLIGTLQRNTYKRMGGGTMWGVVAASDVAELTKHRVIALYTYLVNYDF